jgi:hypothetical protein
MSGTTHSCVKAISSLLPGQAREAFCWRIAKEQGADPSYKSLRYKERPFGGLSLENPCWPQQECWPRLTLVARAPRRTDNTDLVDGSSAQCRTVHDLRGLSSSSARDRMMSSIDFEAHP